MDEPKQMLTDIALISKYIIITNEFIKWLMQVLLQAPNEWVVHSLPIAAAYVW